MILQADLWMKLEVFTVNLPERHLLAAGMLTLQLGKQITLTGVDVRQMSCNEGC